MTSAAAPPPGPFAGWSIKVVNNCALVPPSLQTEATSKTLDGRDPSGALPGENISLVTQ